MNAKIKSENITIKKSDLLNSFLKKNHIDTNKYENGTRDMNGFIQYESVPEPDGLY